MTEFITQSTRWAVYEPNDERLRASVRKQVSGFLMDQWRTGALQGATAEEACSVVCDEGNNKQSSIRNGEVHMSIGFAPLRPAEFIHLTITQRRAE